MDKKRKNQPKNTEKKPRRAEVLEADPIDRYMVEHPEFCEDLDFEYSGMSEYDAMEEFMVRRSRPRRMRTKRGRWYPNLDYDIDDWD